MIDQIVCHLTATLPGLPTPLRQAAMRHATGLHVTKNQRRIPVNAFYTYRVCHGNGNSGSPGIPRG
jgi:hypothetical protein